MDADSGTSLVFLEDPRPCSYLPIQTAALEYRFEITLPPDALEESIRRGWRRFGVTLFRPDCPVCTQCVPVRVDVQRFQPTKSQRRTLKRNDRIHREVGPPTVTGEHIRLYNDWHADMSLRSGWHKQTTTRESYEKSFLAGVFPSARELRYFESGRLIGVGLIDQLPCSLSSAYFYHAPDWRPLGPGTFSLLQEIQLARELGKEYLYLGYWIADCPSMAYKNRFRPYEILFGRPDNREEPDWRPGPL